MRTSRLSSILNRSNFSNLRDAIYSHSRVQYAAYSTMGQDSAVAGRTTDRIFTCFSIYKGKASLSLSPVLPTFTKLESGGLRVERQGVIMLRFCPAAAGDHKYDWEKRQMFAMSATEVGALISLGPNDSCEFLHDPSMKSNNSGQVRKTLSIRPTQDGNGFFISLNVVNNLLKNTERFVVPTTTAEFAVMKTACSFALPHIIGWNQSVSHQQPRVELKPSQVSPKALDLEWDR